MTNGDLATSPIFCYVGTGYMAELAKELDFDFGCGVFQNQVCVYPLEQARDIYPVWEQNFLTYCISIKPFEIKIIVCETSNLTPFQQIYSALSAL